MKKRTSIFLALIGILGLVVCGRGLAASVSVNVESAAGVQVYGPSTTDFAGVPSGNPAGAIALSPVDQSWP